MRTFHAQFSTLTLLKYSICFKSFPGLSLRPSSAECLHCSRDLCTLKLYTCANNMDPGKLPPQLQVSNILFNCRKMCIVILLQFNLYRLWLRLKRWFISAVLPVSATSRVFSWLHVPTGLWRRGILQLCPVLCHQSTWSQAVLKQQSQPIVFFTHSATDLQVVRTCLT